MTGRALSDSMTVVVGRGELLRKYHVGGSWELIIIPAKARVDILRVKIICPYFLTQAGCRGM